MSTYVFGKLTRSKFYTPNKSYTHKTVFPHDMLVSKQVPCKISNGSVQVFYNSPVFNSYLTVAEEKVYKLYSVDNKTTITKKKIESNTLYTFKVVEETKSLRICEIYNNDLFWVGKETFGKLNINKKKCKITTPFGKGEVILQNNITKKKAQVLLWKVESDLLFFVEINNPVKGVINVNIDSVRDGFTLVSNGNIRGVFFSTVDLENKTINVYVKEELLGFYIFEISNKLLINCQIEAEIVKKMDTKYLLKYQTYTGFINIDNIEIVNTKENFIKGKVINIKNGYFELSQEQKISLPFDTTYISDIESEEIETNEISTFTEIINLIKKLTENKKYNEVTDTFYKYIHTLNSTDKDNLSLVYTNFLEYINDPNIIKKIKKISKFCTDKYIKKVGDTSENFEIVKFCYLKIQSKPLYTKYIDLCFKLDINVTDFSYLDVLVDLIYKFKDNPRIETEKIVGTSKEGWMSYIKNETLEYKRILYRRVVNMKWKLSDMKEWYKMWMQYEKDVEGNVEEVRSRANEFVENIKSIN